MNFTLVRFLYGLLGTIVGAIIGLLLCNESGLSLPIFECNAI